MAIFLVSSGLACGCCYPSLKLYDRWVSILKREADLAKGGYFLLSHPIHPQAGKLDLTEVEGLADLLAAETEAQRIQVTPSACTHVCLRPVYRARRGPIWPLEEQLQKTDFSPSLQRTTLKRCSNAWSWQSSSPYYSSPSMNLDDQKRQS